MPPGQPPPEPPPNRERPLFPIAWMVHLGVRRDETHPQLPILPKSFPDAQRNVDLFCIGAALEAEPILHVGRLTLLPAAPQPGNGGGVCVAARLLERPIPCLLQGFPARKKPHRQECFLARRPRNDSHENQSRSDDFLM